MTQPELPFEWYAMHSHVREDHESEVHQHFGDHGDPDDHAHVPLVPFNPAVEGLLGDLAAVLEQLRAGNKLLLEGIVRNGAKPDLSSILGIRVEILLQTILGDFDSAHRLRYEIAFEQHMKSALTQTGDQVRRAKLLAPPTPPPGQNGAIAMPPGFRP